MIAITPVPSDEPAKTKALRGLSKENKKISFTRISVEHVLRDRQLMHWSQRWRGQDPGAQIKMKSKKQHSICVLEVMMRSSPGDAKNLGGTL
jgi:hypothetical protein